MRASAPIASNPLAFQGPIMKYSLKLRHQQLLLFQRFNQFLFPDAFVMTSRRCVPASGAKVRLLCGRQLRFQPVLPKTSARSDGRDRNSDAP